MAADVRVQEEVDRNFAAFQKLLPMLAQEKSGQFCLMHGGEVVEAFDTAKDAFLAGRRLYPDGLFSIQEVRETPLELGSFSHAVSCS